MKPLKIFLLLLLMVAVICTNDRYTHNKGVEFYEKATDDDGDGNDVGWDGDEEDDSYDDYNDNDDYDDYKDYDKDKDNDDNDDDDDYDDDDDGDKDWKKKKVGGEKAYHHHYHHIHLRQPKKPTISVTTRPPHHGNYNDGYNNGFNAGLLDPNNRNHTIEYIRTTTDCGIIKRIDVIDGVSYTFSTMTTVGFGGVTRTEIDLDGSTILLPYTGADKMMSTIPLNGITRTVIEVEDEATTLPIRIRPSPSPINNRMLEEMMPPFDQLGMAAVGGGKDERRMALDANYYGKSQALAVGDDGISGTVLRHIKFDQDGFPIIPSNAGTRPVYIINGRTTTLRNGIPISFPVDNGHTRTVVALRSDVLTLPLTGGDEITKLLPLDGLTETVVVFDEMTYTLSPDDNTTSGHSTRELPSKIVHTVVVEEIFSSITPPPAPTSTPTAPTANAAAISGLIGAAAVIGSDDIRSHLPSALYKLPPKTIAPPPSFDDIFFISKSTTTKTSPLTNTPTSTISISTSSSSSSTTTTTTSFSLASSISSSEMEAVDHSIQSHCSTKWILEDAQTSEGCYLLSSVVAVDSDMRDVDKQGYWTTNQCHSFCANSTSIQQLPSYASWYYGLTLSAEKANNAKSSTCRCMADLSGAQSLDMQDCHTMILNNTNQSLGLFYIDNITLSTIYIYQATYRCLLPSLIKRTTLPPFIDPPETWQCHPNALVSNKRVSEGCYPYLTSKVTIRKTRSNADGTQWYWTAAKCYSFCLDSGRVPTRSKWYYGITLADPGSALIQNSCLCMLEMGSLPTATGCHALSYPSPTITTESNTKIGIVNTNNLTNASIYAYEVDYTCSSSCNDTTSISSFNISDTKATEGCYLLSNYADRVIKKTSRTLTRQGDGIYTPNECFHICKDSGLIIPGQSWWYGISMSDPTDTRKGSISTTSCRCSIEAPSMSRHNFLAGRCNHHDVGLVDSRFLYRINNGVYVYKVSYQCSPSPL